MSPRNAGQLKIPDIPDYITTFPAGPIIKDDL
jgi:hypothetical protein